MSLTEVLVHIVIAGAVLWGLILAECLAYAHLRDRMEDAVDRLCGDLMHGIEHYRRITDGIEGLLGETAGTATEDHTDDHDH